MKAVIYFSNILIPIIIMSVLMLGAVKKVQIFTVFTDGAKQGIKTVADILPSLIALMVAVSVVRHSTVLDILNFLLTPVARLTGFPAEAIPVALMRLVSSSAAMGMAADIFKIFGPDSFVGRVVSVMMGCTETVFYTLSIYSAGAGIKDTGFALKGALIANVAGVIASFIVCKAIWGQGFSL